MCIRGVSEKAVVTQSDGYTKMMRRCTDRISLIEQALACELKARWRSAPPISPRFLFFRWADRENSAGSQCQCCYTAVVQPVYNSFNTDVAAPFTTLRTRPYMLSWAMGFLILAIIAGVLGFGGIAATSAGLAKILFVVFLVIFVVTLIMGRGRGKMV